MLGIGGPCRIFYINRLRDHLAYRRSYSILRVLDREKLPADAWIHH